MGSPGKGGVEGMGYTGYRDDHRSQKWRPTGATWLDAQHSLR